MLSPLFNLRIQFEASRDYVKLSVILTVFAVAALAYVHYTLIDLTIAVLALGYSLIQIIRCERPHPSIDTLSFQQGHWLLTTRDEHETRYSNLHICVDTGLFMLLKLSDINDHKHLILFYDQIPKEVRRMLHVIAVVG